MVETEGLLHFMGFQFVVAKVYDNPCYTRHIFHKDFMAVTYMSGKISFTLTTAARTT
jgi:hypothetical protein